MLVRCLLGSLLVLSVEGECFSFFALWSSPVSPDARSGEEGVVEAGLLDGKEWGGWRRKERERVKKWIEGQKLMGI